jgi:predicted enzyme involved in methoxymalonyl-ACP biosynthesis
MKKEDGYAFVDTWLMSCRVLKRTMEDYIVNTIVSVAKSNGFDEIRAEYIPTAKNAMVKDIYKEKGFTEIAPGNYVCRVEEYQPGATYIK